MPGSSSLTPPLYAKKQEPVVPALIGMIKIMNEESLSTIN